MEMIQCDFNLIIGVDVSKDKLDFSKGSQGNPKTIANSSVGPCQTILSFPAYSLRERIS